MKNKIITAVILIMMFFSKNLNAQWSNPNNVTGNFTINGGYINLGDFVSDPSDAPNGTMWYNTTSNTIKIKQNGVVSEIGSGGGGVTVGQPVSGGTASRLICTDGSGNVSTASPCTGAALTLTGALSGTSSNFTGQMVFDGPAVDISTGTNQTLTFTPNGTGGVAINSGTTGVTVTDGSTASGQVDWASAGAFAFTLASAAAAARFRSVSAVPYLEFVTSNFLAYAAGGIGGNNITINSAYSATGNLTLTGGIVHTPVSPSSLSGDVTDYAGCDGAAYCRINGGAADRLVNSLSPHAVNRALRICNVGTTNNITLVHASGLGTASYRFTLPGAANKTIVPNGCVDIQHDGTSSTWRGVW